MKKIAVLGAGITGTLVAYFLAKKGFQVSVFEKEPHPAMQCSHANGGQISVCNAQTWNTWSNVKKGLKWMLSKDAPLLIRPTPEFRKLVWLAGFLRHTVNNSHLANTLRTIELGKRSAATYDEIIEQEHIEFSQLKAGLLHVYTREASFEDAIKDRPLFENNGVSWKPLSVKEALALDPNLAQFKDLVGAIHTPEDWTGDAHEFCNQLKIVNESKYGVVYYFSREMQILTESCVIDKNSQEVFKDFDAIVLSTGHQIIENARKLGDFLNIYPVKGYSLTIEGAELTSPKISLLDDDNKIVCSHLNGKFRIAGTAELAGENYDILKSRIDPLFKWCKNNFPQVDARQFKSWACLRPMSSNMMPIYRESSCKGIYYHGGHGHLGWTLGAATAKDLAQEIENKLFKKI